MKDSCYFIDCHKMAPMYMYMYIAAAETISNILQYDTDS